MRALLLSHEYHFEARRRSIRVKGKTAASTEISSALWWGRASPYD